MNILGKINIENKSLLFHLELLHFESQQGRNFLGFGPLVGGGPDDFPCEGTRTFLVADEQQAPEENLFWALATHLGKS